MRPLSGCVAKNLSGMGRTGRFGSLVSFPHLESDSKQFSDEPRLSRAYKKRGDLFLAGTASAFNFL